MKIKKALADINILLLENVKYMYNIKPDIFFIIIAKTFKKNKPPGLF